jgi:hypothetical protein
MTCLTDYQLSITSGGVDQPSSDALPWGPVAHCIGNATAGGLAGVYTYTTMKNEQVLAHAPKTRSLIATGVSVASALGINSWFRNCRE